MSIAAAGRPPGEPLRIQSRDNALVKELRHLVQNNAGYRRSGRVWLEGDHLCRAALARGWAPAIAVFSASFWPPAHAALAQAAIKNVVVDDALMRELSGLQSPAPVGFVADLPPAVEASPGVGTVVLDRLQDPGNVGSILRSAAAFGMAQVLALKGTAALWGPKVLRAGMGAHFGLRLIESVAAADLPNLGLPLLITSSHRGVWLHQASLPYPCAWVFGHEGQGVAADIEAMAAHHVRIAQPGGEESLNVAAAAAVCLHAGATAPRAG